MSIKDKTAEIHLMDTDGSNAAKIASAAFAPDDIMGPFNMLTWSPDGSKLAFFRNEAIHVMDADGSNLKNLWSPEHPNSWGIGWSHDSTKIYYYQHIIDMDGILLNAAQFASFDRTVQILLSPDSNMMCYTKSGGTHDKLTSSIYVAPLDETTYTQLTPPDGHAIQPSWSPDGSKIAFIRFEGNEGKPYVIDADDSNLTRLTDKPIYPYTLNWSPDGEKLLVLVQR